MSNDRHELRYGGDALETVYWLRERGYRAAVPEHRHGTAPAVFFAKGPNGQVRMALVGETLVSSGTTVKVEAPE